MAANKVVFGNKVLIDLTGDTVTEEALLKGYTAHKADGTIITGTAFAGYPNEFVFLDNIEDSSGTAGGRRLSLFQREKRLFCGGSGSYAGV